MIIDVRMKLVCWCLLSIRFIYIHQFSDAINDYVDESYITPSVVADYYQHLFELLLTSAPPHEEYDHREGSQSSSVIGPMRMMTEFCVLVVEYDVIHGVHHHRRHHQQRLKHHQQHNPSSPVPTPLLSHLLHSSEVLKQLLGLTTYTTTAISLRPNPNPSINAAATNGATATASINAASSGNSVHHHHHHHHHHHNISAFITSICRCYFQLVHYSFSEVLNFVLSLEHLHRFDSSTISPSTSSTAGINDGLTGKFLTAIMFLDAFITSSSSSLS
jgi:hypothetical protein